MTLAALKEIINSPAYHDLFAILKGARNGLVLGCKVRFPHALVIAIFFGRGECVLYFQETCPKPDSDLAGSLD